MEVKNNKTTSVKYFHGLYVALLPAFFVLHGYVDFFEVLFFRNVLKLYGLYLLVSAVLLIVFRFFFKSFSKAALFVFFLMCYYFFFGPIHDAAKKLMGQNFLTSYSLILPASLIFFFVLFVIIKKTKSSLFKLSRFLSVLLGVLIIVDLVQLINKVRISKSEKMASAKTNFTACNNCKKPDVYFIVLDEYAGNRELKEALQFDNSEFENELNKKRFHVIKNSISNYSSTPFSMASTFNMEYLNGISGNHDNRNDISLCYKKINHSKVAYFFKANGYQIKSFSFFTFNDIETLANNLTLFPTNANLITSHTFFSTLKKDLGFYLITKFHLKSEIEKEAYPTLNDNNRHYNLLLEESRKSSPTPRFIYTHLMMPHGPFYYSKDGKLRSAEDLLNAHHADEKAYVNYLQYCNKKVSSLIDQLLFNSNKQAIIILIGDHGLREFERPVDIKYYFYNLSSIYLPDQNYNGFYDGMSNVNLFRSLLNTQFHQSLPMLKDSTILIK